MLYYLFNYLEQLDFPGARMFGYVSFRSLMAIILSLLISAIFGEYFIKLLKRKQITVSFYRVPTIIEILAV